VVRTTRPGLYALGSLGASLLIQTLVLWVLPFYAPPGGERLLPPERVGVALALGRLANAASDPLVAYWSDRLRSRWGRRRPFVLGGAPLLGLAFLLVWTPPPVHVFWYLCTVLCAFFFLFSSVVNPYLAWIPEFTPGRGRISAAVWQAAGNVVGTGIAYTASAWLIGEVGFAAMGVLLGTVAVLLVGASSFAVHGEEGFGLTEPFGRTVGLLLGCADLRAYFIGLGLAWVGLSLLTPVLVFFVTVLMGAPRESVGIVLSLALVSTLLCLPVVLAWARRMGARRALGRVLGVAALLLPLISLIGRVPGIPAPWHGFALVAVAGLPLAGIYALPNAVLADLAAAHRGREAMHFALQGLTLNLANAAASALVGLLLTLGYAPGDDLGLRLIPLCSAALCAASLMAVRSLGRE
jgi:GPH family glycoside/pentoside/hexuronide:cation symporter